MSARRLDARVQATADGIVSDWQLEEHPPGHQERPWSSIEAFGVGRPQTGSPEGIYLLLREAPHGDFCWLRAQGALALVDALRARGVTERAPAEIEAEADRRRLAELDAEAGRLFGPDAWARARPLLEAHEPLRRPDVRRAIVRLSRGDVARLDELTRAALRDARDVLAWAQLEGLA